MKYFYKIIAAMSLCGSFVWAISSAEQKQNAYQTHSLAQAEYNSANQLYRGLSHADFSAPASRTAFLSEGHVALNHYVGKTSNNMSFSAMTPYFKLGVSQRTYNSSTNTLIPDSTQSSGTSFFSKPYLDSLDNVKIESMNIGTGAHLGDWVKLNSFDIGLGLEYEFVQAKDGAQDSVTYERRNLIPSLELQLGLFDLVAAYPITSEGAESGRQDYIGRFHFQDQWEFAVGMNNIVDTDIYHYYVSTHKEMYQMISLKAQLEWVFHYGQAEPVLEQVAALGTAIRFRPVEKSKVSTWMYKMASSVPTWMYDWEVGADVVVHSIQDVTEVRLNVGRYF